MEGYILEQQENKNELHLRKELDSKYKWKLEDIYENDDKWEADFKKVNLMIEDLPGYKGKLGESADTMLKCFKLSDDIISLTEKIFVYAKMKRDEDNDNSTYQALTNRAMSLYTKVNTAVSFITPEVVLIPEKILLKYIDKNEELKIYEQFLKEIIRQKKHILTEREEVLLASATEVSMVPGDVFTMFNNADVKFPYIKDENGEEVEVTKGRYIKFLENKNRRIRKEAFHALYSSYKAYRNTLAASLTGNVKKNMFYATARKYNSCLEASLDDDNIPVKVYDNLINTVNENLYLLHKYVTLRKKTLNLNKLHMYDLYVPIVEQPEKEITYEKALELVENGLRPMGQEYIGLLKKGFKSGWIDVFESRGKTSGAYSWGAYGTHPYVLMNYQNTIKDVFTIAHEMGHALHSYYTDMNQPYVYSQYKIFVAEVASTVNELLLMDYLMNNTSEKDEKAYLINHYLEEFRGTVFRQVMFAEFEKIIHEKMENREGLTVEVMNRIYHKLNKKYFGNEVVIDEDIDMEWSRIPHFYSSFYVYKYATGFSAAISIARQILDKGKPAAERYKEFLKSGSSDYPIELLKKAGVDLTTTKPVEDGLNVFSEILDEFENIL